MYLFNGKNNNDSFFNWSFNTNLTENSYTIHFKTMEQINIKSGKKRKIKKSLIYNNNYSILIKRMKIKIIKIIKKIIIHQI